FHCIEPFYLLGVTCEQKSYELYGLTPGDDGYFTFEQIAEQLAEALRHEIAYNQEPEGKGPAARLFSWGRQYYVNTQESVVPLADPLPFGQVSPQALPYSSPSAVFPASMIEPVYGSKVTADDLTAAGYVLDSPSGYWWN